MSFFEQMVIADKNNFAAQVDAVHRMLVDEPYRLAGPAFIGTNTDTNFWSVANSGAGSGADVGTTTTSIASLVSGTANSGYGKITSLPFSRFVPGSPNHFKAYMRLTATAVANTTRAWGCVTLSTVAPQDGFFFAVSGAGVLSVNGYAGGSPTFSVASGSFNGNVTSIALDANLHIYEISYSTSFVYFFVDAVLIHLAQATTVLLANTLNLPINAWSANSASGTATATLQAWNMSTYRYGNNKTAPRGQYFSAATAGTVLKYGAGELHTLVIANTPSSGQVTLYDNTTVTGTPIFDTGGMSSTTTPFYLDFGDLPF